MLNLATLCFPDRDKSCFYCCPPIRDPEADPLDDIEGRKRRFRKNRRELAANLEHPREISGQSCWGLGFLDDGEKQIGCLLHPLQNRGRELRHLTGYQFKCANALCREARVFAELGEGEKNRSLELCREMDSFHYSSRSNPLMQLLAWEKEMAEMVIGDLPEKSDPDPASERKFFLEKYGFLWQVLDFRLDGWLATRIAAAHGLDFLRRNLGTVVKLRHGIVQNLQERFIVESGPEPETGSGPAAGLIPSHTLAIPLPLSRLLKFGADLWELPAGCEPELMAIIDKQLEIHLNHKTEG